MSWLAVYVEPRREFTVWSLLKAAGLEAYYPLRKRRIHRRGATEFRFIPVISRYVFVPFLPGWEATYRVRHVIGILDNDGIVVKIADQVIEDIRKRQLAGEFDEKPTPKKRRPRWQSIDNLKKLLHPVDSRQAA